MDEQRLLCVEPGKEQMTNNLFSSLHDLLTPKFIQSPDWIRIGLGHQISLATFDLKAVNVIRNPDISLSRMICRTTRLEEIRVHYLFSRQFTITHLLECKA